MKPYLQGNPNCRTYKWVNKGVEYAFDYHTTRAPFEDMYYVGLLGGQFPHAYGVGHTPESACISLKIRLYQLGYKPNIYIP